MMQATLEEDQMTAIATFERTSVSVFGAFKLVGRRIRALQTRRAGRKAIATLLEFDPDRLEDLGISAADVRAALTTDAAGRRLASRRAANARAWSPDAKMAG
jgi:uncharacterized protein YjiS (DUF1127 family)